MFVSGRSLRQSVAHEIEERIRRSIMEYRSEPDEEMP